MTKSYWSLPAATNKMASLTRRLVWSFSSILRESFPIVSNRSCVSLLRGSWRKVLSVGIGTSLCAIPVGQRSEPTLSSECLIKRAAYLVADSSSMFLSQTTYALVESLTEYTTAVYRLISLQKYTSLPDKMNLNEESDTWQVINGARVQMKQLKEQYLKYESSWKRAVSLSEMAAEAAYQSGADQASVTVRNHIQIVQSQVQEAQDQAHMAEVQLTASQAEEIKRTITEDKGNPPSGGSPRSSLSEEEEIPEAYLRED